ncbi:FecR family protein [Dyadobacter soli]|uniref:FecR family protein n=1 Tax=Dyadobacter soli TaxID=659014 RepID=A0A1G6VSR2_9BACT|nr:FecR domain-containing protein [Dyadobacter soli]SDD56589.1 FecR family protein [Dyadobacter soli]
MNDYSARLFFLLDLYNSGEATSEQTAELMDIIREGKHDRQLDELLGKLWKEQNDGDTFFTKQESDQILNFILTNTHEEDSGEAEYATTSYRWSGWWRWAAAAVILVIGFGAYQRFNQEKRKEKVAVSKPQIKDLPPGGNRALLTLADGSTIILDSAANGLLATQGDTKISKKENGQLVYNAENAGSDQPVNRTNMLATPKGGQYQLLLPDGSKVWLNALSSIKYPATFPKSERKVEVTGEVFFEVQKDRSRPFKVVFGGTEVEALGTSFNVMAYKGEPETRTTLVEGAVLVTNNGKNQRLKPGQQAAVGTSGNITTSPVDVEAAIAWKKGLFYFRDAGIQQVMKSVARWYDVEIRYEGAVPVRQFTGKIPMDVNISELLQMLNYAGVGCAMEDGQVVVSAKNR